MGEMRYRATYSQSRH